MFLDLDERELERLRSIVESRTFDPGERIFSLGDVSDEMLIVRKGRVHISIPLEGGKRHHLASFSRGDSFGELAFLDRQPRSADADVITPTEVYVLSRDRLDSLESGDHLAMALAMGILEKLAHTISYRLRTANAELRARELR